MKSRGRKPKIYPQEILIKLINEFLGRNPHIQLIKYKDMYNYAQEEYNKGLLEFKLSDDFWRKNDRQGRVLIDEINKKRNLLLEAKKDNFEVISTTDVIERLSQDTPDIKKLIINQLKVNENSARKLSNHYSYLKTKECELQNEIVELKEEIANLKKNNEIYQNVLFQWANLSNNKDISLLNMITTGKTRTDIVQQLFQDMFKENPNSAIKDFNNCKHTNNVIKLEGKGKNTLIEDLNL